MEEFSIILLSEAYDKAIELNLDNDFIHLIEEELTRRNTMAEHEQNI